MRIYRHVCVFSRAVTTSGPLPPMLGRPPNTASPAPASTTRSGMAHIRLPLSADTPRVGTNDPPCNRLAEPPLIVFPVLETTIRSGTRRTRPRRAVVRRPAHTSGPLHTTRTDPLGFVHRALESMTPTGIWPTDCPHGVYSVDAAHNGRHYITMAGRRCTASRVLVPKIRTGTVRIVSVGNVRFRPSTGAAVYPHWPGRHSVCV